MLYNDIEREVMASAIQSNMRTSSPAVYRGISATVDSYLGHIDFHGQRILDIGPGQCDFLDIVKERGAITFGVDYDPAVLKLGEMRGHNMTACNLRKGWPFKDVQFDGIFCRASINCYWFAMAGDETPLREFLAHIGKSLKPTGWMWILPWNKPVESQESLVGVTRAVIGEWAKLSKIRIEVVGKEEKSRYGLVYALPFVETWTKNCVPAAGRDLRRAGRWQTIGGSQPPPEPAASLYTAYEACRKRLLAGETLAAAEQASVSSILEYPDDFLAALSRAEAGGENDWREAYATFIASRPRSGVLYSFVASCATDLTQARLDKTPGTKGRVFGWGWTYWGRSAVYAYRATGEQRFADIVLDVYERLLNERDDSLDMVDDLRQRVTKCWGVFTPEEGPVRACEVTTTGLILLPICDLLLSKAGDALASEQRERLILSITDCLDEFDGEMLFEETVQGGYFRAPFDNSIEGLNHAHAFAAALVKAYQLTGNEKYRRDAKSIARYFLAACTAEANGTYSWAYAPSPGNLREEHPPMSMVERNLKHGVGGEAFYKAAVTTEFPAAAYGSEMGFSTQDLERIADSFLKNVLQADDDLNLYVSSRKIRSAGEVAQKHSALYMLIAGFSLLDSVRPEIRGKLVRLFGRRPDWFPRGWFGGSVGSMALARFMSETKQRLDE